MGHDSQLREMDPNRLDSWKEIAAFLRRDARTVRRWERERHLPVHRVPGGERSGVFAYVAELEDWLHADHPAPETHPAEVISLVPRRTTPPSEENSAAIDADPIAAEPEPEPVLAAPLSALHSLNTCEVTSAAETTPQPELAIAPVPGRTLAEIFRPPASRAPGYHAVSLLFLLTVSIGVSLVFVHYRDVERNAATAHRPTPEAQDLYLRGRYEWNLRTEEGLNSAVDLFTQAIVHDPGYAPAYAGLADSYLLLRQYGHMPNSEAFPRAFAAARQAIALDDSSPEAHRSLAFILRFWNWDMPAAEKEYRRAIALNPSDSQTHHWYATALLSSDRPREALEQIDIARSLEPQSVSVLADRGLILSMTDPRAALAALQQVERTEPGFSSTHVYLSEIYLGLGDYDHFLAEGKLAAELQHDAATVAILDRARGVLARRGPRPMLHEIAMSFAPLAETGTVPAYTTARLFGLAGEPEQAMHYLRLACEDREPGFLNFGSDAAFKLLRSSPEYNALLSRRNPPFGGNKEPIARLDVPKTL